MRFDAPPIEGILLRRYQRFLADVRLADGRTLTAHCPNTGSLLGCQEPGSRVWLRDSGDPARKLRTTWQAIRVAGTWVNVDTSLPNRVVAEALRGGRIAPLRGYPELRREVPYGKGSRIDVLLTRPGSAPCYVEVKSTTLAEGDVGLFPDAVTARGKKHLEELVAVVRAGGRAVQLFFVSRSDVRAFRPADAIDPAYGEALREAAARGVLVLAWTARVEARGLELGRRIRVDLRPPGSRQRTGRGTRPGAARARRSRVSG